MSFEDDLPIMRKSVLKLRTHNRAHPCSARQSMSLTKEMIFDYLIVILAQKAEKTQSLEILQNFKNFQKI